MKVVLVITGRGAGRFHLHPRLVARGMAVLIAASDCSVAMSVAFAARLRVAGSGFQFAGEAFRPRPADVVDPAELFEDPDDACGDVELSSAHAVAGAGGVGVVGVVPGLAHGGDSKRPE